MANQHVAPIFGILFFSEHANPSVGANVDVFLWGKAEEKWGELLAELGVSTMTS